MPSVQGPINMGPDASLEDRKKMAQAVYDQLPEDSIVKQLTKAGNKCEELEK